MGFFRTAGLISLLAAAPLTAQSSSSSCPQGTRSPSPEQADCNPAKLNAFFQWEPYVLAGDTAPSGKHEFGHSTAAGFRLYTPKVHNVFGIDRLDANLQIGTFARIVNGSFPTLKVSPPEPIDVMVHSAGSVMFDLPPALTHKIIPEEVCSNMSLSTIFFRFDHRPSDENPAPEGKYLAKPGYYTAFAQSVGCFAQDYQFTFEKRIATTRAFRSSINDIRSQLTLYPSALPTPLGVPLATTASFRRLTSSEDQQPYVITGLNLRVQTVMPKFLKVPNLNFAVDVGEQIYTNPYPSDQEGSAKKLFRISPSIIIGRTE